MQTINTYLYPNILVAQFVDPTIFTTRNRVVYTRTIKVYQGIDNPLQVQVKNQDQKPIDTTGYLVQVDIQDPQTQTSVESLAVTMTNPTKGQGTVTIPQLLVNSLDQQFYKITIKLINQSTNNDQPLYIDDNYGARADLQVLPGWYESMPLSSETTEVIDGGTI